MWSINGEKCELGQATFTIVNIAATGLPVVEVLASRVLADSDSEEEYSSFQRWCSVVC